MEIMRALVVSCVGCTLSCICPTPKPIPRSSNSNPPPLKQRSNSIDNNNELVTKKICLKLDFNIRFVENEWFRELVVLTTEDSTSESEFSILFWFVVGYNECMFQWHIIWHNDVWSPKFKDGWVFKSENSSIKSKVELKSLLKWQ